jgi:hypothetical protein
MKHSAHIFCYWQAKARGEWEFLRGVKAICKRFGGSIVVMSVEGERVIDNTGRARHLRAMDKLRGK